MIKTKHIVIIVPPQTSILDVAGPLEVFTKTTAYVRNDLSISQDAYTVHVLSIDSSTIIHTAAGLPIICEGGMGYLA